MYPKYDDCKRTDILTRHKARRAADGWVTMHGPKIAMRRRKGEENAAMACGGGREQLEPVAEAVAGQVG